MHKLDYVNLGCGSHYHCDWVNIDFISPSRHVIAHNLLRGIPLDTNSMDVVYHSHVLEHFPTDKAGEFIGECYRVLKPGGIIRIAIPDLQEIIRHYVRITKELDSNPEVKDVWAEYDWITMELYDQTVRNVSGGNMAKHLRSGSVSNKAFIIGRCGDEVKNIIDSPGRYPAFKSEGTVPKLSFIKELYRIVRYRGRRERIIQLLLGDDYQMLKIGRFRSNGEIHQWMYDRYSLRRLLNEKGFENFEVKSAFESNISNWRSFNLDGKDGIVRKPDSLFAEAKKSA